MIHLHTPFYWNGDGKQVTALLGRITRKTDVCRTIMVEEIAVGHPGCWQAVRHQVCEIPILGSYVQRPKRKEEPADEK